MDNIKVCEYKQTSNGSLHTKILYNNTHINRGTLTYNHNDISNILVMTRGKKLSRVMLQGVYSMCTVCTLVYMLLVLLHEYMWSVCLLTLTPMALKS